MSGLYIHIPFCVQKCIYCDFYSETCRDEARVAEFLTALDTELRLIDPAFIPTTLFFGGGTSIDSIEMNQIPHVALVRRTYKSLDAWNKILK